MQSPDSSATRVAEYSQYLRALLPWAHGHQLKGISLFVAQILDRQSGVQAELARGLGNHEAASKRLSRLLHNPRLSPAVLSSAVLEQALRQLPTHGMVRLALDWTSEGEQQLLVLSLIVGRRGVPIYWRAYAEGKLKGHRSQCERGLVRRVLTRLLREVEGKRVLLTADRGFADVKLFALLEELGVFFIIRTKSSTKICLHEGERGGKQGGKQGGKRGEEWCALAKLRFSGNTRHLGLGHLLYCAHSPLRLWVTMSRARNRQGGWGVWFLASNWPARAKLTTQEYGRRFGCEEGFRDAKWWLGFAQARIACLQAWSRLFGLFVMALLVATSLSSVLLGMDTTQARRWVRRVASRRRSRWELSSVSVVLSLLRESRALLHWLSPMTKILLEPICTNVS